MNKVIDFMPRYVDRMISNAKHEHEKRELADEAAWDEIKDVKSLGELAYDEAIAAGSSEEAASDIALEVEENAYWNDARNVAYEEAFSDEYKQALADGHDSELAAEIAADRGGSRQGYREGCRR